MIVNMIGEILQFISAFRDKPLKNIFVAVFLGLGVYAFINSGRLLNEVREIKQYQRYMLTIDDFLTVHSILVEEEAVLRDLDPNRIEDIWLRRRTKEILEANNGG